MKKTLLITLLAIVGLVIFLAVAKNMTPQDKLEKESATAESKSSNGVSPTPLPDSALGPGDYTMELSAWHKRPYEIHIPSTYDASRATPVVLVLHGGGANSESAAKLTCPDGNLASPKCLDALADREGFIVVYPNGTARPLLKNIRTWNAGGGENGYLCVSQYACENDIDDIAYFKDLLDNLSGIVGIDRTRVYATGISNGGAMSNRLACELSDWVVAIASVGGGNQFSTAAACEPVQPVSVLEIHGKSDPAWPYDGGSGAREGGKFYPVSETISGWVARNGCSSEPIMENIPDTKSDGTTSVKDVYKNCHSGGDVVLITVENGGHTWPQGNQYLSEKAIGKTSQDFSANEVIWQFFADHPRKTNQTGSE